MSESLNATKKRMTGKRSNRNFMRAALSHSSQGPAVKIGAPGACRALALVELERGGVDAIALPGRLGPVVEDVPEVRIAPRAVHLGPAHEEARVLLGLDRLRRGRLEVRRPAGAGVELVIRAEERLTTADAVVCAAIVVVPVHAAECALRAVLACHLELVVGEMLAPLLVGLADLFDGLRGVGHSIS